uniref:Uncharacterized protein n=1 Tax=Triticum urartu TaxID=4572 RepID=A0A8R7UV81_TRIUA
MGRDNICIVLESWHLSYLQKEGTRPSSCLAVVSSFDSFLQHGGDMPFFTSRATIWWASCSSTT